MFGFSNKKGNYAYTTTRAKAKKSLLLKEEDYNYLESSLKAPFSKNKDKNHET